MPPRGTTAQKDRLRATFADETLCLAVESFHGRCCLHLTANVKIGVPAWNSSVFALKKGADYSVSLAVRSEITAGYQPIVWLYFLNRDGKRVCSDITIYRTGIRLERWVENATTSCKEVYALS